MNDLSITTNSKTNENTAPHRLRAHVRSLLAHYKCPRAFNFVAELPKTATGKIQRFRLRKAPPVPA